MSEMTRVEYAEALKRHTLDLEAQLDEARLRTVRAQRRIEVASDIVRNLRTRIRKHQSGIVACTDDDILRACEDVLQALEARP